MPIFAECCVLIPCGTIEDFPTKLGHSGAKSLLGALTAAWHPHLLADIGRLPTWSRADEPPAFSTQSLRTDHEAPFRPRLVLVPEASVAKLPADIESQLRDCEQTIIADRDESPDRWIRVSDRSTALELVDQVVASVDHDTLGPGSEGVALPTTSLRTTTALRTEGGREIQVDDFFALAYTYWQIQTLTRRLRYTSNLDVVHFESCVVDAAKAFQNGDVESCEKGLHDAFDSLAEERDHYFSSDPALIDLTLLTPQLWPKHCDDLTERFDSQPLTAGGDDDRLPTPQNLLIDEAVAKSVTEAQEAQRSQLRNLLAHPSLGWCGGGPESSFDINTTTIGAVEERFRDAMNTTRDAVNASPTVFARLGGGFTIDLVAALAASGCRGIVPIDFIAGRGFEDESKVIYGQGGHEIDALVAKPIDANNESDFLGLSIRLGEAIDRGEIATGLLVHWPAQGCDSFRDVRRAATWTLALGKFWRLDEYFEDGESPYHHGDTSACRPSAATNTDQLEIGLQVCHDLESRHHDQSQRNLTGLTTLAAGRLFADEPIDKVLASALGFEMAGSSNTASLIVRADQPACRVYSCIDGNPSYKIPWLFHQEKNGDQLDFVVDVPGWGFASIGVGRPSSENESDPGFFRKLKDRLIGRKRSLISGQQITNEFMDVVINPTTGGIDGIYSGQARGNRFSSRWLIEPTRATSSDLDEWSTRVDSIVSARSNSIEAQLELTGQFTSNRSESSDNRVEGKWEAKYKLRRGSRALEVHFRYQPPSSLVASTQSLLAADASVADAWNIVPRFRCAVADPAAVSRIIIREKLHRTSSKRFFAPSGFVIDEDVRTTTISGVTLPWHRRSGDRFFDTLLWSKPLGQLSAPDQTDLHDEREDGSPAWTPWMRFRVGIDVPDPIGLAKESDDSARCIPIQPSAEPGDARGWLMHAKPDTLHIQVVQVAMVTDDLESTNAAESSRLALHLRVVQTASRSAKGRLQLCREITRAFQVSPLKRPLSEPPVRASHIDSLADSTQLDVDDGSVTWHHGSHEVIHLVVLVKVERGSQDSPS